MQATGGSSSIRWSFDHLRQIGAQTRELLRAAAAEQWSVPLEECRAAKSYITHTGSDKKLSYGELAGAAAKMELPQKEIPLKPKSEWTLLGTPAKRLDTPFKVNGSAGFGIDTQLDGLLVATIKACPVFGGKLKTVDEAPALAV
jgi:CO/xanthine dehydrogenase Mo-binding subunit